MSNNSLLASLSGSLIECFSVLPDPRIDRTKQHKLIDIVVIGFCTILDGGEGFTDMEQFGTAKKEWFKSFLELPNGIPSHDTFNRVFQALDPAAFAECFINWTEGIRKAVSGEVVAIDGKALRRARNISSGGTIPYMVSAWATSNGLSLGQVKVDEKSNEITAIPVLLRSLNLEDCIVSIDAMGCQKKIAREIIDADADYVLALKGNHGSAHEEIKCFMDDMVMRWQADESLEPELGYYETIEKSHGRIETRRYWQSNQIEWFEERKAWEKLTSFGMVESIREINGETSVERRYYLSSLENSITQLAGAVRNHWRVENSLHWVLDVTFKEDDSRARSGNSAQNLAILRRLAVNALKRSTKKISMRLKVKTAGWDNGFLLSVLGVDPS